MEIDFNSYEFAEPYTQMLKENFYFFRMYLADEVDAIAVHFLDTKRISVRDAKKLHNGLYEVLHTLNSKFPDLVAKTVDEKLKLAKEPAKKDREMTIVNFDNLHHGIVFNLSKVLLCSIAAFAAVLESVDDHD
jgi:hypothetical protein